jgi:hypothetical protein
VTFLEQETSASTDNMAVSGHGYMKPSIERAICPTIVRIVAQLELLHTYSCRVNTRTTSAHDMASDRFSSLQCRAGDYGVNSNVLVRRIGISATV